MLNLTKILNKAGQTIIRELSLNIAQQKQIDGSAIQPVAETTRLIRIKNGFSSVYRLLLSGNFYRNAFKFIVEGNTLRIFGNRSIYPGSSVSYNDIISYNDRQSPNVNQKIKASNRPRIFPWTAQDMIGLKCWPGIIKDIEIDVAKQIETELDKSLPKVITINIGI